jgi:hypothetical protein
MLDNDISRFSMEIILPSITVCIYTLYTGLVANGICRHGHLVVEVDARVVVVLLVTFSVRH